MADLFDIAVASKLAGGGGGGRGSSYTLLAKEEFEVSGTSTSKTAVGTISAPGCWTSDKIIYVRVRDKAGKRNGYLLGTDIYFFNNFPARGFTSAFAAIAGAYTAYKSTGVLSSNTGTVSSVYGVYANSISPNDIINIVYKYNSEFSQKIDGTYVVEVYALDWPDGVSPFN